MGNLTTVSEEERQLAEELMRQLQGATAPEPSEQELAAQLTQQLQGTGQAQQPSIPEGAELIGTFADNGRVYRMPDGSLGAASAGGATRDEDAISRIMAGESFAAATLPGWQETAIQENPIAARAATAIQGVPFAGEWADEAVGAMFGDTARDAMRFSQEAMAEQRPGQTLGLQLGTGVASAIPLAMGAVPYVARGVGLTGQMIRGGVLGAGAGAIEGAVSGAGEQDNRTMGAMTRGAFGAGLGGLLGGAIPAVTRGIGNLLRDPAENAVAAGLGVTPPAARLLQRVIGPEDLAGAGDRLQAAGRTAMPADIGEGARGLLDMAMQRPETPGIFRRRITDRATEVYGDVTESLNRTMGEPRGLISVEEAIRKNAAPEVRAAYQAAYSTPIDYSTEAGRNIESLLERLPRSTALKAIQTANERMRFDGGPANQIMASVDDAGNVVYQEMPNVMQLDYIKRAFDAIARDGTDPITGKMSSEASFARQIAREVRDATRNAAEGYGTALELASDQLSQEAAVSFGARILRSDVTREMVDREIKGATGPEVEAMRQALRSQIDERLANVRRIASNPGDAIEARQLATIFNEMTSPASQMKMRTLLGDDGADDIMRALREAQVALTLRAETAVNSRTMGRGAAEEMFEQVTAPNAFQSLAMMRPVDATRQVAQAITTVSPEGLSASAQKVLNEAADVLTRSGSEEAMTALRIIKRAAEAKPVTERQAYQVARTVTGLLSAGAYQQGTRTRAGLLQ
jgi:hypothetical protein